MLLDGVHSLVLLRASSWLQQSFVGQETVEVSS